MNARMRRSCPTFPQEGDTVESVAFRIACAQAEQHNSRPSYAVEPLHPGMTAVCRHCAKLIIVVDINDGAGLATEDLVWRHVQSGFYGCGTDTWRRAEPYIGQSDPLLWSNAEQCPYCHQRFYAAGNEDPIKHHVEHCEARKGEAE